MQAACESHGVLLMEAFAYRHSPLSRTIETLLQSGQIGDIRLIDSRLVRQFVVRSWVPQNRNGFRSRV